eukprot:7677979-Pyramimonas_sp.AAC.1
MNIRRSVRIYRIGAGHPSWRAERARGAARGALAPVKDIRAELRKLVFAQLLFCDRPPDPFLHT